MRNIRMRNWMFKMGSFLPLLLQLAGLIGLISAENMTSFPRTSRVDQGRVPRFVSFNSEGNKIGIDFDMSIPILSIPLDRGGNNNKELVNVNAKALTIVGLLTAFVTFVVPFFRNLYFVQPPFYRSEMEPEWQQFGEVINDAFLENPHVGLCTQRFVCTLVSQASHTKNPTSVDKIIDGISSHIWFEGMVEGTKIQDAVEAGRRTERDCAQLYPGCYLASTFLGDFP